MLRLPTSALTRRGLLEGAALGLAGVCLGASAEAAPRPLPEAPMRGMTVSCPGYGRIWGSDAMKEALGALGALGVRWTAVHPYAGVRRDGRIRWTPAADTGYLSRCVDIARSAGQHLFWKPHLAYWGSFDWRGAIHFSERAEWRRFFSGYRDFVVDQATFAEKARLPLFSIGVEYKQTMHEASAWRSIIREVRRVYRGPITYAANWDEVTKVPFWSELDLVGVQAYFPLSDDPDASTSALIRAWDAPMARLVQVSRRSGGRPVLFTELGYPRSVRAAKSPWAPDTDSSPRAIELRRRLLDAALARLAVEPLVRGVFWWKWIPGYSPWDGDFSMKDPEAQATLRRHWAPA